jgi:hypothetical protein
VDDAVLQSNPDFAILYNKLSKVKLNPDGSTKDDPAAKERDRVKEVLSSLVCQYYSSPEMGLILIESDRSSKNTVSKQQRDISSPAP